MRKQRDQKVSRIRGDEEGVGWGMGLEEEDAIRQYQRGLEEEESQSEKGNEVEDPEEALLDIE